jgi:hypothetical protein
VQTVQRCWVPLPASRLPSTGARADPKAPGPIYAEVIADGGARTCRVACLEAAGLCCAAVPQPREQNGSRDMRAGELCSPIECGRVFALAWTMPFLIGRRHGGPT